MEELFIGAEKEFSIPFEGKEYTFALKELSWLEVNKLLSKAVKITAKGLEISIDTWYEEYLVASLTKAPWKLEETRLALKQLKASFGALLEEYIPKPGAMESNLPFFGQK